jgi:hypothetical protein
MAEGVNPLDQSATAVVTQARDALGRVGVGDELAGGVDVVAVDAPVRALAFNQIAAGVVTVMGVLATGVDGFAEQATPNIVVSWIGTDGSGECLFEQIVKR